MLLTSRAPLNVPEVAVNAPANVVAPVTPKVPAIVVFPVPSSTVNLLVSTVIPASAAKLPLSVVAPLTASVPAISVSPSIFNNAAALRFNVADCIVKVLAPADLIN